jgi:DNA modification methylase
MYLGDCVEILPTLPPPAVVVTDPPYGIAYASGQEGVLRDVGIAGDESLEVRDAALRLIDAPALVFGTWKTAPPVNAKAAIVWDKGMGVGMGDLSMPWKPNWELIYVVGKGFRGHRGSGVISGHTMVSWTSARVSEPREHPTQKPVSLILELLSKCPEGAVLDPFAGSGAVGVAALRAGRPFVGVELDRRWFDIACERLRAEEKQTTVAAERAGQRSLFGIERP